MLIDMVFTGVQLPQVTQLRLIDQSRRTIKAQEKHVNTLFKIFPKITHVKIVWKWSFVRSHILAYKSFLETKAIVNIVRLPHTRKLVKLE